MVKADYKLYKIDFDSLVYVEGQSEYVTFHMKDKRRITAYYSLKKLEEEIDIFESPAQILEYYLKNHVPIGVDF